MYFLENIFIVTFVSSFIPCVIVCDYFKKNQKLKTDLPTLFSEHYSFWPESMFTSDQSSVPITPLCTHDDGNELHTLYTISA